jgi:hypothetical protein
MKKVDSIVLKAFLYGLPAVIVLAVFSYPYNLETINRAASHVKLLYNFAGLIFAAWMTVAIYLSIRLMVSRAFRDKVLAKLTLIRERDEREVVLTGKAARTTLLTSLAILIFLFCLACFRVSIYRVPLQEAIGGKTRVVSLGFGFKLLENSKQETPDHTIRKQDIFSYKGLPISSTTIILVLIIWQIISYNYSMRRLTR